MTKKLAILFSVLGLSCCNVNAHNAQQLTTEIGANAISNILHAEIVTASALQPARKPPFQTTGIPIVLNSKDTNTLREIIINDKSFKFGMHKRCLFIPTVAYEFKSKSNVRVYVNPSCQQVLIDADNKSTYIDYDPAAKELNNFNARIESTLSAKK